MTIAEALFDSLDSGDHKSIGAAQLLDMLEAVKAVHEKITSVLQTIPMSAPPAISRSMFIAASYDTALTLPQAYDLFNIIAGPGRDCVDQCLFESNMAYVATQLEKDELGLALSCLGFEEGSELNKEDFVNVALASMSWD